MDRWLLISLLVFGSYASPHDVLSEDEDYTELLVGKTIFTKVQNGRVWHELDKQSKIYYLNGIQDGVTLFAKQDNSDAAASRAFDSFFIPGFHFSDVAKQVDLFYSDSANVRIPIIEAYKYSVLKMRGGKNFDLEQVIVRLRQTYNR